MDAKQIKRALKLLEIMESDQKTVRGVMPASRVVEQFFACFLLIFGALLGVAGWHLNSWIYGFGAIALVLASVCIWADARLTTD